VELKSELPGLIVKIHEKFAELEQALECLLNGEGQPPTTSATPTPTTNRNTNPSSSAGSAMPLELWAAAARHGQGPLEASALSSPGFAVKKSTGTRTGGLT
jgi:hypothetical protein